MGNENDIRITHKRICLDKMYDYNVDKSIMVPNYKEISFGKEDRWENKFTFFTDGSSPAKFGQN
jgi:hypothetical protein